MVKTIPGRECGECFECCRFPPINDARLQKPTNVLCPNCKPGAGCMVYDARPSPCRGWECGWKVLEVIPPGWRPDLAGVVVRGDSQREKDIAFTVIDPSKAFLSTEFMNLLALFVVNGFNVRLQAMGPPGHLPGQIAINEYVKEAIAARDLPTARKMVGQLYEHLQTKYQWEPDGYALHNEVIQP